MKYILITPPLFDFQHKKTHSEEHKVLLVVFSDAVVHPGTVVVHLSDAAFTNTENTKTFKNKSHQQASTLKVI